MNRRWLILFSDLKKMYALQVSCLRGRCNWVLLQRQIKNVQNLTVATFCNYRRSTLKCMSRNWPERNYIGVWARVCEEGEGIGRPLSLQGFPVVRPEAHFYLIITFLILYHNFGSQNRNAMKNCSFLICFIFRSSWRNWPRSLAANCPRPPLDSPSTRWSARF